MEYMKCKASLYMEYMKCMECMECKASLYMCDYISV